MGMVLPELANILIFGVEIRDNLTFSERMSPELEQSYPQYSSEILEEIESLLQGGSGHLRENENRSAEISAQPAML
jgi:hypothetical protein